MATQSLTTIDNLLKTQYLPLMVSVFQEEKGVLGKIMKQKQNAKGGDMQIPVRVGRNEGIGFRSDGDTLPSAGSSTWVKHTVDPKLFYGRIQVSGPAMARTNGGKGKAFLSAFVDESKHTLEFMKKQANVALWGGEEGYLAEVASVTSTTLVLNGPGGSDVANTVNDHAGSRHFAWASEQRLAIVDRSDADNIIESNFVASAVDHSTNTLTVGFDPTTGTNGVATAAGDMVILYNGLDYVSSGLPVNVNKSFEGIQAAIDDGTIRTTYHGLSRSTYPQLKANVLAAAGSRRTFTEALLEDLVKTVYLNCGVDPSTSGKYELRTSLDIHSTFVSTLIGDKRFASLKLGGGHKGAMEFNGIPMVADVDAPFETIFLIDWSRFKWLEVDPLKWLDLDGRVLNRVLNTDAYEARLRLYGEMLLCGAHYQGRLSDITDAGYVLRS